MVEFIVRVPDHTPHDRTAYLTGDGPTLGQWCPRAVHLDRWQDGTRRARVAVPSGSRFLVTLGNWRSVECDRDSRELPPRLVQSANSVIDVHVAGWDRNSVLYHPDFPSRFLPHPRTLTVYVPPGYDLEPERRFPVFYMHDGQNLFDAETAFAGNPWHADEIAERVIRTGDVPPILIVGVANTPARLHEYGPRRSPIRASEDRSHDYGRFLVEEVKPFIDRIYRTLPGHEHTAVGGSSMGGLISLNLCKWYPGVFGLCAGLSPSLWWEGESFLRTIGEKPGWLNRCKIWLDMGDREGWTRTTQQGGLRRTQRLAEAMRQYGLAAKRLRYLEVPEGQHNEQSWGGRFDQVLRFLFGNPPGV